MPLVHTQEVATSGSLTRNVNRDVMLNADPKVACLPFHSQSAILTQEVAVALSGPAHYIKAEELLGEIEGNPALSSEAGTALAARAVAHAVLAAAAAVAVGSVGLDSRMWQKTVGVKLADKGGARIPAVCGYACRGSPS